MSLEQSYQDRRASFITRAAESLTKPQGTTKQIISDGKSQLVVARQDEPQLTEEGMDPALIIDVEALLEAYSWVSSLCDTKIADHLTDKDFYAEKKKNAYTVRGELFKFGQFGCKLNKLPLLMVELQEIIEGSGDEDLIYDMLKLYQLFTNNPTITNGLLKFDVNWIAESLTLHNELRDLRAAVKNPDADSEIEALELEVRQAFDLFNEKINELRDWGQFVFDGEERADAYRCEYMVNRGKKSAATWAARREEATL